MYCRTRKTNETLLTNTYRAVKSERENNKSFDWSVREHEGSNFCMCICHFPLKQHDAASLLAEMNVEEDGVKPMPWAGGQSRVTTTTHQTHCDTLAYIHPITLIHSLMRQHTHTLNAYIRNVPYKDTIKLRRAWCYFMFYSGTTNNCNRQQRMSWEAYFCLIFLLYLIRVKIRFSFLKKINDIIFFL